MENKTQDYQSEILAIIRGNTSPGVMRNKLEDYHENDLADVFSELTAAERRKVCRILNLDMLSDIERIADHCSNVAVHVLSRNLGKEDIKHHEYIDTVHKGETKEYADAIAEYSKKYKLSAE